jgi:ATP-dependent exoDNAse (exonuclease V) beta subunit
MVSRQQPPDFQARTRALDPSESFIVQAPAGSGKTSLLTDRVLALLAQVERPEQIVAMTFTRKAAAEMHARVMEKLQRATSDSAPQNAHERQGWLLARAALGQDAARGWGLLQHPARLRIQTIDSFCASLVRSMPWLTGLGGMPRIVDYAPALYEQAAKRVIDMADDEPSVRRLLQHLDLSARLAIEAISDMLGKRDQWLPLIAHADDAPKLQRYLHETLSMELQSLAESMPMGWQDDIAQGARMAAEALRESGSDASHPIVSLLDWQAGELLPDVTHLARWRGLAELLTTKDGTLRKSLTVNCGCPSGSQQKKQLTAWLKTMDPGGAKPTWLVRLARVRHLPQPGFEPDQWEILKAQLDCLILAYAELDRVFAEKAQVDFIEVSYRAVQSLGETDDPSDLLLKLDNRIAHLLVDEFQDTSLTQLNLLRLLTAGWQDADGRTLFLVGDPMQSIYRFRKAEVGLFLQVQQKGIGDVSLTPLTLSTNFRSQAGIVTWVNQTFSQVFSPVNDIERGAIRYEPADAWNDVLEIEAVKWHLLPETEASWQTVVSIAKQAWEKYADSDKPMAILVRSRSHLQDVARELVAAGFAVRAVELDRLQSRGIVVDLLQLTRAMVHRADRAAWLAVLRAPWSGLTLGTLLALFSDSSRTICDVLTDALQAEDRVAGVSDEQWQRLRGAATVLLDGLLIGDAMPLAARIETIWRRLQGERLCQQPADWDDAQAYLALLERLAQFSDIDLDELERQLPLLYSEPQAGDRAIEIMTMHKAKGLEFESVVLLGLERKPRPSVAPLVRVEQTAERVLFGPVKAAVDTQKDPLSAYLSMREEQRAKHEVDRLLYVAATRARKELHLIGTLKPDHKTGEWKPPVSGSLLERLWQHRREVPPVIEEPEPVAEIKPVWSAPAMVRSKAPLSESRLASSSLSHGLEGYRWVQSETPERLSGILIHAWLAQFAQWSLAGKAFTIAPLDVLTRQLKALGMPAPLRSAAAEEVTAALRAMIQSDRGQWLLSQPLRKVEWALIDAKQTISIVDLAIEQPEGWLIVDYKTTRIDPDEDFEDFCSRMRARYGGQLQRYRDQLTQLDGRQARSALYFPRDDIWLAVP